MPPHIIIITAVYQGGFARSVFNSTDMSTDP